MHAIQDYQVPGSCQDQLLNADLHLCFCEPSNRKLSQDSGKLFESFLGLFISCFLLHARIRGVPRGALKGNAAVLTCCSSPAGGVLIAVVPAVVVAITGPVVWDAAAAGALELGVGTGTGAAHFIAAIPTIVI